MWDGKIDLGVTVMDFATLRKRQGFPTQESLAKRLRVSTSTVGNWEAGLRRPRYNMLVRLGDVLGVPIGDIKFPPAKSAEKERPTNAG